MASRENSNCVTFTDPALTADVVSLLSDASSSLTDQLVTADASTLQRLLQCIESLLSANSQPQFIVDLALNISKLTSRDLLFPDEKSIAYSTSAAIVVVSSAANI